MFVCFFSFSTNFSEIPETNNWIILPTKVFLKPLLSFLETFWHSPSVLSREGKTVGLCVGHPKAYRYIGRSPKTIFGHSTDISMRIYPWCIGASEASQRPKHQSSTSAWVPMTHRLVKGTANELCGSSPSLFMNEDLEYLQKSARTRTDGLIFRENGCSSNHDNYNTEYTVSSHNVRGATGNESVKRVCEAPSCACY